MYPMILVSKVSSKVEEFVNDYIKRNVIHSYSIFKIEPEKEEITIEQIRKLKKIIATFSSTIRLFIFYSFNSATLEAQNALLKTLEESQDYNRFILIADQYESILPTIRSRSQLIRLDNPSAKHSLDKSVTNFFELVCSSVQPTFLADSIVENLNREKAIKLIEQLIIFLYDKLLKNDSRSAEILKKTLHTQQLLVNNNLNPQLSIDNLLLFIWRTYNMEK